MFDVASFTGHRPDKFSFKYNEQHIDCIRLKSILINQIEYLYLSGTKKFLTGCALGVDMWCGEIVLDLKEKYNDIELYCILPCKNQDLKWNENYKKRFNHLLNNCSKIHLIQEEYSKNCFFKRNKYLVDNAKIILAVYNQDLIRSGTKNTINYAKQLNKKILIINSKTFNINKI